MCKTKYGHNQQGDAYDQIQFLVTTHRHSPFPQDSDRERSSSTGCPVKYVIQLYCILMRYNARDVLS